MAQSDWSNLGDRDDPDDVMETCLTIDYDKQSLNCVSTIGSECFRSDKTRTESFFERLQKRTILNGN